MRASGISVFTTNVPALSRRSALAAGAAALMLSAGLPLLPGAFSASACGAPEAATATATATNDSGSIDQSSDAAAGFGTPLPDEITAGGAPVELDTELARTGSTSPNGFLLGAAASFVLLGAGTLIVVRRLCNQG